MSISVVKSHHLRISMCLTYTYRGEAYGIVALIEVVFYGIDVGSSVVTASNDGLHERPFKIQQLCAYISHKFRGEFSLPCHKFDKSEPIWCQYPPFGQPPERLVTFSLVERSNIFHFNPATRALLNEV